MPPAPRIYRKVTNSYTLGEGAQVLRLELDCGHTKDRRPLKKLEHAPQTAICPLCEALAAQTEGEREALSAAAATPAANKLKEEYTMPKKSETPEPLEILQYDPELPILIRGVKTARDQKSAAEKMENAFKAKFQQLIDAICKEHPEAQDRLKIGSWPVTRSARTTRTIDADLLMAQGVSPAVIAACTKETAYYVYTIGSEDAGEGGL